MGSIRIGISRGSPLRGNDLEGLDVIEIRSAARRELTLATAQRWRAEAPDDLEFTITAPRIVTHPVQQAAGRRRGLAVRPQRSAFSDTPAVRKAWKHTIELAHALEASFVIFPCPATLGPSDENVENLIRFFQWAHRGRLRLGWQPRGSSWTDDRLWELCRELSLTHVVDPFVRSTVRGRPPYFRIGAPGAGGTGLGPDQLAELARACAADVTYCIFTSSSKRRDALRFRDACALEG